MKKLFLIDLLMLALVIVAGLTWSIHDQSEYADRLDHYGLSETTVRVKTASTMTPAQAAQALAKTKLQDVQVQMQSGHTIYLWGKGRYASLPLTSGSWFSDADLTSPLPTAVVGQALEAKLHLGSNQHYLPSGANYIPVLGIVASRQAKALNQVTFINAASAATGPQLNTVTVLADGPQIDEQLGLLTAALKAKTTAPYTFSTSTQRGDWWARNRGLVLAGITLLLGALALGFLAAHLAPLAAAGGLDAAMQDAFLQGWWRSAVAQAAVATAIGGAVAWWQFYFTNPLEMLGFAAVLWAAYGVFGFISLTRRFKHERITN